MRNAMKMLGVMVVASLMRWRDMRVVVWECSEQVTNDIGAMHWDFEKDAPASCTVERVWRERIEMRGYKWRNWVYQNVSNIIDRLC